MTQRSHQKRFQNSVQTFPKYRVRLTGERIRIFRGELCQCIRIKQIFSNEEEKVAGVGGEGWGGGRQMEKEKKEGELGGERSRGVRRKKSEYIKNTLFQRRSERRHRNKTGNNEPPRRERAALRQRKPDPRRIDERRRGSSAPSA